MLRKVKNKLFYVLSDEGKEGYMADVKEFMKQKYNLKEVKIKCQKLREKI